MSKKSKTGVSPVFNRFVKIRPDRGFQSGLWVVEGEKNKDNSQHTYLLKHHETKERIEIYAAHTFRDGDCVRAATRGTMEHVERVKQIGLQHVRR